MKNKILEYYKEQIKNFEKIKFDDAKKMLADCIDKDDMTKKETFEKVFKGTLYLVINYVVNAKYELISSYSFDLNDVINCSYYLWYKKICSFDLLKYEDSTRTLAVNFSNEIVSELIPCEKELEYIYPINQIIFIDMLVLYINMRNNNVSVNYSEFINKYVECFGNKNIYYYLAYGSGLSNQILLETLERIYLYLSNNDKANVDINKLSIKKINKLLAYSSRYHRLSNNFQSNDEFEEKICNEILYEQLDQLIFNNSNFSDKEKEVLAMRWGLKRYDYHTLEDVGNKYDVTRERIRQIESKVFRKLRRSNDINKLGKSIFNY